MDYYRTSPRARLVAERKAREEKKMIPIHKPHEHDVLCGRGHSVTNFPGNVYFRALVGCFIKDFVTSTTTAEKSSIAKHILSQIKERDPPGHFLRKKNKDSKIWHEIADKGQRSALNKIGQALRDHATGSNEGETGDCMDGNEESLLSLGEDIHGSVDSMSVLRVAQQDRRRPKNMATITTTSTKSTATLSAKSLKLDVTTHTDMTISSSDLDDKGELPVVKNSALNVTFESLVQEATEAIAKETIYDRNNLSNDEMTRLENFPLVPSLCPPISPESIGATDARGSNNGLPLS